MPDPLPEGPYQTTPVDLLWYTLIALNLITQVNYDILKEYLKPRRNATILTDEQWIQLLKDILEQ